MNIANSLLDTGAEHGQQKLEYVRKIFQICNKFHKYHKYFVVKMEGGISNKTIVCFFAESGNDDVIKNFIGVFSSNFVNRFISFHGMISESGTKYPFTIINTDQSDKKGTHWWSFLDFHPKKEIFKFDSFVFKS